MKELIEQIPDFLDELHFREIPIDGKFLNDNFICSTCHRLLSKKRENNRLKNFKIQKSNMIEMENQYETLYRQNYLQGYRALAIAEKLLEIGVKNVVDSIKEFKQYLNLNCIEKFKEIIEMTVKFLKKIRFSGVSIRSKNFKVQKRNMIEKENFARRLAIHEKEMEEIDKYCNSNTDKLVFKKG
ncbi:hypothetical protein ACTFIW_005255 [Dictyostelium discoideum]